MVEAQAAARELRHGYIGTEHLLLGLLAERDRVAAQVLRAQGVDLESARAGVTALVSRGEEEVTGQIPFTPRAKKTLELALREAIGAGANSVAPEHILLGLLREGEGAATRVLKRLEIDLDALRAAVIRALPPPGPEIRGGARHRPLREGPGARRLSAEALLTADAGFLVEPSPALRRLLMSAGARALDNGRTLIEIADVEEALRRQPPEAAAG